MKLPLIGSCEGDVTIFASVGDAEKHIEIIDVLEGNWKLWDSEGHVLNLRVTSGLDLGRFEITEPDPPVNDMDSLREALIYALAYLGHEREKIKDFSLATLCILLQ